MPSMSEEDTMGDGGTPSKKALEELEERLVQRILRRVSQSDPGEGTSKGPAREEGEHEGPGVVRGKGLAGYGARPEYIYKWTGRKCGSKRAGEAGSRASVGGAGIKSRLQG